VNVLVTVLVLALAVMWALAVYGRLNRLRAQVVLAWKRLEPDRSNEVVRTVYNKHVRAYNAALEAFPANLIGQLFGFKPANPF
jgi:hypothetical protein